MLFREVVDHLAQRKFCERKSWNGEWVLVFGMDNAPHLHGKNKDKVEWRPSLAEFIASDWVRLPFSWNGTKDDFKPFNEKVIVVRTVEEALAAGVVCETGKHCSGLDFIEKFMMKCKTCGLEKTGYDTSCYGCRSLSCYKHSVVVDGYWYCFECALKVIKQANERK